MKISHLFAFLLATASVFAGPESLTLAGKVIEAAGTKDALEDGFMKNLEAAMAQLKKTGGEELANEVKEVARQFFKQNYQWSELSKVYAEAYASEFTDAELQALLAFYESPVGKKSVEKMGNLNRRIAESVNVKMQDKMPQLQAAMMDVVKKHLGAKQGQK